MALKRVNHRLRRQYQLLRHTRRPFTQPTAIEQAW
jgi:hypothetical protein